MHRFLYAATTVFVLVAAVSVITHSASDPAISSTAPVRHFYLTKGGTFDGAHALTACATGYHTASLWEIHEPSNLTYNKILGFNLVIPARARLLKHKAGSEQVYWRKSSTQWVSRTATCGQATCQVTMACELLDAPGFTSTVTPVAPWEEFTQPCNLAGHVWCVRN